MCLPPKLNTLRSPNIPIFQGDVGLGLWVSPDLRGRGLGSALLDAVLLEARGAGVRRVLLNVADSPLGWNGEKGEGLDSIPCLALERRNHSKKGAMNKRYWESLHKTNFKLK